MQSPSPFKNLLQTAGLVYKFVLMLAAGAFLVAFVTACFQFRAVHVGIQMAEQAFEQGRFEEANDRAVRLEPWSRCFPGRFRQCALLQVRCLARLKQPGPAARMAEALRLHADTPVPHGSNSEFIRTPLLWLQKTSLFLTSGIMNAVYPAPHYHEWTGYEALLDDLVASRNAEELNALADDLIARFPRSPISVMANSAKGELQPASPRAAPYSASLSPAAAPEKAPSPLAALLAEPDAPAPELSPSWGIVTNPLAMALNPGTGKPIRPLKAGDVLAIEGTCMFENVSALTGTLILNNRNVPDLAFYGKDLELRSGAFDAVPPEEVAMRSRLAEIQAEEAVLQPKLARELASLSPEETAYRQAKAKMETFQREVDGLNAKLAQATGSARMTILDKLRLMKYQEQTLVRDLQTRKESAELTSRKAGRLSVEPQLAALRQEKKAILKRLAGQAP